ncbi:putative lipid transfer [Carex littledalei]|uniref:Putative lipid transfer n=1 Tax=Carex littledalei TaxID=544730 RepID=A0A833QXV0_9POAL|nr:putative lipid transfer [Carex littledalei]
MMSRGASKYTMFTAATVAVIVMIIVQGTVPAQAGLSAADCKAERREGINSCKPVLYGKMPSDQCCEWIRGAHLEECVCALSSHPSWRHWYHYSVAEA